MGHVGAVGPWVGKVVEHQFQSPAMLEGVQDGQGFRSGFAGAAGPTAIAAARGHKHQSAPRHRSGSSGGEAGLSGTGGSDASHDHFHCSEETVQQHNQDPLDNEGRDTDGVGVVSATVQTARCSDLQDSLGWDKDLTQVSEGQHSRKGWMGGNHLLNIDPAPDCRHHGHLDNLQALPVDCTVAEHPILKDRYLHSVLRNETEDTSNVEGSLNTEERP